MRFLFILLFSFFPALSHALTEGELLEPQQAFKFSARAVDGNTVEVRYKIADGYYMYRDKFKFETTQGDVSLGAPQLPPGKVKQDEFFGRVETYRKDVKILVPVNRAAGGAQTIQLKATSQGCADAGVCYPPQEQTAQIKLAAVDTPTSAPAAAPSGLAALKQLGAELGGPQEEFLPPDQAFILSVTPKDGQTLIANFKVAKDYYLYRDKIAFQIKDPNVTIATVELPKGDMKDDPTFGKTEVYHRSFDAVIRLKRKNDEAQKITLAATYQGCSEKGICYPPANKNYTLTLAAAGAGPVAASPQTGTDASTVAAAQPDALGAAGETPVTTTASDEPVTDDSEQSQIARLLEGGNFWVIVAAFFVFGLLLSFTPCVFPMIPILSGIIAGQGAHLTKRRALLLSIAYVLGMAITYALAGVAAGLSGTMLSAALQNPWVLGSFALVFVALAFSMFGFYELQLPNFIQSKFSDASNRMKGGNVIGVFIMGILSAVIVGPCVAAPLAGALLYIGQTGDVWLGGWALFAMAIGMGVPLILVGVSAGALLPKAGAWMSAVKSFFGVLLLGVAIWLISPVIPALAHMLLWAALLIVSAIYLKAIDPLPQNASGFSRLWKGVGVILLVAGLALLVGALAGNRDILQPLSGLGGGGVAQASAQAETGLKFEKVKTVAELEERIRQAGGKPVMLDFYADWCVSCKEMERFTFSDPRVQAKLKDVILLKADVTANNADDKALLKKFNLFGPPGLIFYGSDGQEIRGARVIGYSPADKFLAHLEKYLK